ncbi:MFS transporter [Thermoactinomyces sp. CICC 10735]|uniref:MFS transporter n=1 Tax=Thermoactinomyces sp. CICC 10735 TaxID=2767430 RepID=UPI0018DD95A0|nr:MFS transporter [Thermoactinomyces sp. CICC 10735]MBH8582465.1 MFS transporter [Thermoactinomyces sp. CICC 10735]
MKKRLISRNRNYRFLWLGQTGSVLGDWFNQVALAQTVLFLSDSALSVGILLMCRALPSALLGVFTGPVIDHFSKKKIMILTDLARGLIVSSFMFAFLFKQVWILYAGSFLIGCLSAFFNPSRQAAIPSVVARKDLAEANSFSSATDSMIGILGAVLGRIVSTAFNPLICFVINAISYFWSAFCIFQMKWSESVSPSHSDSYIESLKKGFHEASRNQVARAIILIGISWGFAGGGYYILIPLLGNNVYQMQGLGIGILYAVDGLGVLTGAYLVKKFVNHQYRRGIVWYGASYLFQAVFFAFLHIPIRCSRESSCFT